MWPNLTTIFIFDPPLWETLLRCFSPKPWRASPFTYLNFMTGIMSLRSLRAMTELHCDILRSSCPQRECCNVFLCLWFRASLIYINNCPTRCNAKQPIYCSASSIYMFRMSIPPIIRSTQNSNYSLRYWSYFFFSYLPPTWPS